MMPQQPREAEYRFQLTVWLAMVISIGMYFVAIRLIQPTEALDDPTLINMLLIMALCFVVASVLLKNYFIGRAAATGLKVYRRLSFIVPLVFCESAALFGVVAWFTTGYTKAYWFFVLGLAGDLLHFPVRSDGK